MDLGYSVNLKKLPDLSTATTVEVLRLNEYSSLVELPSSIGDATNLETLDLKGCTSLVKLPSSIGNATNLEKLELSECARLVKIPFSIGNLHKLSELFLKGCSKLEVLPININLKSLDRLVLTDCLLLKSFPEISTNISYLGLTGTAIEEVPPSISLWSRLKKLEMSYRENLKYLPHTLDSVTELHLTDIGIQEIGPWVKGCSRLRGLVLNGMQKLVSIPQLPDSLEVLDAENCEALERLDCSFRNPYIFLSFRNCFKLNQEAKDLIIQASNRTASVFPGGEVPSFFSDRATGGILTVKLNETHPHDSLRFKACVLLVTEVGSEAGNLLELFVAYSITDKQNGLTDPYRWKNQVIPRPLTEHLYTFELEVDVTSNSLFFELDVPIDMWAIKEWGVRQLS